MATIQSSPDDKTNHVEVATVLGHAIVKAIEDVGLRVGQNPRLETYECEEASTLGVRWNNSPNKKVYRLEWWPWERPDFEGLYDIASKWIKEVRNGTTNQGGGSTS